MSVNACVYSWSIITHVLTWDSQPSLMCSDNVRDHRIYRTAIFIIIIIFWPRCTACGILVPRLGIKSTTLAVEAQSLNHWTAREVTEQQYYFECHPQGLRSASTLNFVITVFSLPTSLFRTSDFNETKHSIQCRKKGIRKYRASHPRATGSSLLILEMCFILNPHYMKVSLFRSVLYNHGNSALRLVNLGIIYVRECVCVCVCVCVWKREVAGEGR